ncbi:AAEL014834-PA [Aedes aegypti]|uniref:Uncharacterized protein n=2 Tax=Aedes aegypti TaxID=7159 RepID=Q16FB5_AEDAE|nr:uncharacterized protein LOC5569626 [Aedes aegypti]EAT32928.1 AAEL014834-PA [Aedes aegypti]
MMKLVTIFVVLCGISAGYSIPQRNGFMYYQQPLGYQIAQRTMYGAHFQNQQFRNQRVAALPSMLPYDADSADLPQQGPNVESVAEAYPSEQFPLEDEAQPDVPAIYEEEAEEPIADEPLAAPANPAVVSASIPERKKKSKTPVKADSDEKEEQDAQSERRGASGSAAPNAYFPINFGSANGGAIAVANSYSTGQGGSATSTATAYGSPATAELRRSSVDQLRNRPAKIRGRQ